MSVFLFMSHDAIGAVLSGAPVIDGTAGSLTAALDAFFASGYANTTLASLVVSGGIATATVQTGHPYQSWQWISIAGASVEALNGLKRITRLSATSFTFPVAVADGNVSGTITAKVAPCPGWEKIHSASNRAVWRSSDARGRQFYYRLDDTTGYDAALRGYRAMTDVDNGSLPFPSANTVRIAKDESGSGSKRWLVVADSFTAYLIVCADSASSVGYWHAFGDLGRLRPDDVHCSFVAGWSTAARGGKTTVSSALGGVRALSSAALATGGLPSGMSGVESSIDGLLLTGDGFGVWRSGGDGPAYPAAHGGALAVPLHVAHGGVPRGRLRGVYALAHASGLSDLQILDIGGQPALAVAVLQNVGGSTAAGAVAVQLDDWGLP